MLQHSNKRILLICVASALLVGCDLLIDPNTGKVVEQSPTPVPVDPIVSPDDPRLHDPAFGLTDKQIRDLFNNASCDAMGDDAPVDDSDLPGGPPDYRRGLRGRVVSSVANPNPSDWYNLDAYSTRSDAVPLDTTLYYSALNVPTRPFSAGFPLLNGNLLKNAAGDTLFEYFRINFDGFLELSDNDDEGAYELAVIADDGVRLKMGLEQQTMIDSPSVTPSQLMCASHAVNMVRGAAQPMQLGYFQGPRYHIALMMLWRKAGTSPEPLCGQAGNDLFFDSSVYDEAHHVPSAPQPAFNDLKSRGWSVVKPVNFRLPDSELFNPCMSAKVKALFGWQ